MWTVAYLRPVLDAYSGGAVLDLHQLPKKTPAVYNEFRVTANWGKSNMADRDSAGLDRHRLAQVLAHPFAIGCAQMARGFLYQTVVDSEQLHALDTPLR